jgi:hypothetical protein
MFRKFIHGSGKIGKDNIKSVQDACGSVKVASEASQDARGTVAAGGSLFSHHKTPVQIQDGDNERPENPKKLLSYKRSIENAIRNIEKWKANFDKLKTVNENGANIAKLPAKHKMRSWVDVQRRKYWLAVNNGLVVGKRSESMYERGLSLKLQPLTQDQVDALEALGMEWDPLRANFEARLADMKDYVEQHGSLEDLWKDNRALYEWALWQRRRYLRKSNEAGLPENDANRLREWGFDIPKRTPDGDQDQSGHPKNPTTKVC